MTFIWKTRLKLQSPEEKIKTIREIWNRMPNQIIILDEGNPWFDNEAFCFVVRINLVMIMSYEFCNCYFFRNIQLYKRVDFKTTVFSTSGKNCTKVLNRIKFYIHTEHNCNSASNHILHQNWYLLVKAGTWDLGGIYKYCRNICRNRKCQSPSRFESSRGHDGQ